MVRLSCFNSPTHSHKKQTQQSFETKIKMLQANSQNEPTNNFTGLSQSPPGADEQNCKIDVTQNGKNIKRSFFFGCASPLEIMKDNEDNNFDGHIDVELSVNGSYDGHSSLKSPKSHETTPSYHDPDVRHSRSPYCGFEKLTIETFSSYMEKDEGVESVQFEMECGKVSSNHTYLTQQHMMAKSLSMPNFESVLPTLAEESSLHFPPSYRESHEDHDESQCDSDEYAASGKDWIIPTLDDDEVYSDKKIHEASSSHNQQSIPNKNFKMKRIEDWVTDLQECAQNKETGAFDDTHDKVERPVLSIIDGRDIAKPQVGMNPMAEVAKKYMSSLSANTTTAQLNNLGLVVIPLLSAFVSLKVVNLSGNSIVKITAGTLPRGLHMLNISKNKISAIEGLRELTRLRILDVSYNKITRIGRGLATCSSLKEIYLAGNKISEVDGLHRLLKLSVLDLRFNKISTTKGLGLLAANYNSLKAISVEGNLAQKNVGDEQLKKYLMTLLPNLAYYNRRSTKNKASSYKDSSKHSVRSDRSHKSNHNKLSRRASYSSLGEAKQSSHRGQVKGDHPTSKRGKSRYGNLPPSSRHQYQQQFEMNMKPLDLNAFSMRKSQSVGNLRTL